LLGAWIFTSTVFGQKCCPQYQKPLRRISYK
jgi:hypothetical protein